MQCRFVIKCMLTIVACIIISVGNAYAYRTHKVAEGETLWGLSRKYNVSIDELINNNTNLHEGLKAGKTIIIPDKDDDLQYARVELTANPKTTAGGADAVNKSKTTKSVAQAPVPYSKDSKFYVARFGDNFANISKVTGVAVAQLQQLNPFVDPDNILEGTIIRTSADLADAPINLQSLADSIDFKVAPNELRDLSKNAKPQTIVMMLPINASSTNLNRQNQYATEFYKGFLISAYKNKEISGLPPVKIIVIDTYERADDAIKQLKSLNIDKNTLIITPSDPNIIPTVEAYAKDKDATIFNIQTVRGTGYIDNPNVIQGNINQSIMYQKAISYLMGDLKDYTPVILTSADLPTEKSSFTDALRKSYGNIGKDVATINYTNVLTEKDLEPYTANGKYVFIPMSGTLEAFLTFSEALKNAIAASKANPNADIKVFGFPDWVTFTGADAENLHNMNAEIYSRIYIDENDVYTKGVLDDYTKWYGAPMVDAFPKQGMLGYDTGNLIFKSLRNKWDTNLIGKFTGASFNGEQSPFHFVHDNNSKGLINDALYIIQYLPAGTNHVKVI